MPGYEVPRLPLSVVSGYIGILLGTFCKAGGSEGGDEGSRHRILHVAETLRRPQSHGASGNCNNRYQNRMLLMVSLVGFGCILTDIVNSLSHRPRSRPNFSTPDLCPPLSYQPTVLPEDAPDACSVCLTCKRDTLIEDCQHLVMCWGCYDKLLEKKCPACQGRITRALFTFAP
eukprot:TRINITY_DN2709_c1_g4_i1.p1 TRINITY_DN2709_c1_g4~~TRINITY_DN2709_c1_g4_i1.p1  ORF type:complete len:195 (+),score=4.92 TRINITY_DN2709_c1_g4_i1:68-586(+)